MKVAFVATLVMVGGINVFNAQRPIELSDVAMANVEALANGEDSEGECLGIADYSFVGKTQGTLQEFFHLGSGRDRVIYYNVERCVAEGNGTMRGSIGILSKMYDRDEEVNCTGRCNRFF